MASEEGAVKEEAATAALKKQAQQAKGAGDKDEDSDSELEDSHGAELIDDDRSQSELHVGGNGSAGGDDQDEPVIIRTLSSANNGVQSSASASENVTGSSNPKLVVVVDNTLDSDVIVSNKANEHSDDESDSESESSKHSSNDSDSNDEDKMVVEWLLCGIAMGHVSVFALLKLWMDGMTILISEQLKKGYYYRFAYVV